MLLQQNHEKPAQSLRGLFSLTLGVLCIDNIRLGIAGLA
jgi:hypothetical protein